MLRLVMLASSRGVALRWVSAYRIPLAAAGASVSDAASRWVDVKCSLWLARNWRLPAAQCRPPHSLLPVNFFDLQEPEAEFDVIRHTVDELGEGDEAAELIARSYQGVSSVVSY